MASRYLVFGLALIADGSYSESISCKENNVSVVASIGTSVALPCAFNHSGQSDIHLVWQIRSESIVLKANQTQKPEIGDESFCGRVHVPPKWYQNGKATLQISRLNFSDAGQYNCILRKEGPAKFCAKVELQVNSAGTFQPFRLSSVWMAVLLLSWTKFLL